MIVPDSASTGVISRSSGAGVRGALEDVEVLLTLSGARHGQRGFADAWLPGDAR